MDSLRTMLRDAEAYGKAQAAYAKDKSIPRPAHDVVLESMLPALSGQMPVIFPADRANDIRDAVTFAEEMHLKPIIMGGQEAPAVAAFLKQHNVPVIVTAVMKLPSREDDPYDVNYSIPAKLAAAGVHVRDLDGRQGLGDSHAALQRRHGRGARTLEDGRAQVGDALAGADLRRRRQDGIDRRRQDGEHRRHHRRHARGEDDTKYLFIDGRRCRSTRSTRS